MELLSPHLCCFVLVKICSFGLSQRTFLMGQDLETCILNLDTEEKNQQTNPCVKEGCRSWCLLASAYLHNDLIHFAMSYSIRFEDGNSVGFIGWNFGREEQLVL